MIGGGLPTPATPPSLGYVGQWGVYTDLETRPTNSLTGLPLVGVRYYDPYTGRFPARDAIGDGVNWYNYANGNPVKYMDPTGESAFDPWYQQSWSFFKGEVGAVNPVNMVKGTYQTAVYLKQNKFSKAAVKTIGKGLVSGLMFWNKEDEAEAGASFMTDVLLVAPAIKKLPNPTGISLEVRLLRNTKGVTLMKAVNKRTGEELFRADWHRLPLEGKRTSKITPRLRGKNLPHYHRRGPGGRARHRPYEQGPGKRW